MQPTAMAIPCAGLPELDFHLAHFSAPTSAVWNERNRAQVSKLTASKRSKVTKSSRAMGNWQSTKRRRASLLNSARAGDVERVRQLVHGETTGLCFPRAGIGVDATDESGRTALMVATASGHEDVVRLLVNCGASVIATDSDNMTPLHLAVENGHFGVVRYLFDHGSTVSVHLVENGAAVSTDSNGLKMLFDLAVENGHMDVARYFAECSTCPIASGIDGQAAAEQVQVARDSDGAAHRAYVGVSIQDRDEPGTASLYANNSGLEAIPDDRDQRQTPAKPTATFEWFLSRKELQVDNSFQVGRGGFGQVYRAKWLNSDVVVKEVLTDRGKAHTTRDTVPSWVSAPSTPPTAQVAQTTHSRALFSTKDGHSIMQMFRREADIWFRLNHPHVVQLFGACDDTSGDHKPIFVSEFATNGPLDKYLATHPEQLWQKLYETALGIQYLHERGIVHGDLKCDNIVVGSDLKAKLTDFGLSSVTHQVGMTSVQISGAVQWVAPECLGDDHKPATIESDVYSLGMCIIQALRIVEAVRLSKDADQFPPVPWENVPNEAVPHHAKKLKVLPMRPRSDTCTDEQWALVKSMCAFEPVQRIKIAAVVMALSELASRVPDHPWKLAPPDIKFEAQWRDVQDEMNRFGDNSLRQKAFQDLQVIVRRLYRSNQPRWLIREVDQIFDAFLTIDLFERHRVLTAASSKSSRNLRSFCEKLQWMWLRLSQPDDKEARAMPEDVAHLQRDLIVSEIPEMWVVSPEFDSDRDRRDFLAFLKLEMERKKYTGKELALIQSAHDGIDHGQLSYGMPKWFAARYEMEFGDWMILGGGSFGSVYRGKWLGSDVVVKRVVMPSQRRLQEARLSWSSEMSDEIDADPPTDRAEDLEAMTSFVHEAGIWFSLSHPHVVRLYAACHIGNPFFLCELASNGTLNEYLRTQPDHIWEKLLEAALGMQYLYERNVIHGNLKCKSIVVGGDGKAKVTDFGLSSTTIAGDEPPKISRYWNWVAPECFEGARPSFESDVYSLGMCIIEALRVIDPMLQRREWAVPWGNFGSPVIKYYSLHGGLPSRPTCSDSQWQLVEKMCRLNPQERLTISSVVKELRVQTRKEARKW